MRKIGEIAEFAKTRKLINSSVGRGGKAPAKTAISQKIAKRIGKSQNLLKLLNSVLEEVEGRLAKTAIFAIFPKYWRNRKNC